MLVVAGRNLTITGGLTGSITHISLHNNPTVAGAGELSGGSYARQAVSWTAVSAGVSDNVGALTFAVPASTAVTHVGFWSALAAGTFFGYAPLNPGVTGLMMAVVPAAGNLLTSYAHGLVANDTVRVAAVVGSTLPTGLALHTAYFVIATGLTADAFSLSLTQGGAAVAISAAGELFVERYVTEPGNPGGYTLSIGAGALDLEGNAIAA